MSDSKMEYGAGRMSKRHERKQALLWRLVRYKQARKQHIAEVKRTARLRFNTENKPLGG